MLAISSVLSICLSVVGCPGARRCVSVDLTCHNGRAHCGRCCHITWSEVEQYVHDRSNKEQPGPGARQK